MVRNPANSSCAERLLLSTVDCRLSTVDCAVCQCVCPVYIYSLYIYRYSYIILYIYVGHRRVTAHFFLEMREREERHRRKRERCFRLFTTRHTHKHACVSIDIVHPSTLTHPSSISLSLCCLSSLTNPVARDLTNHHSVHFACWRLLSSTA